MSIERRARKLLLLFTAGVLVPAVSYIALAPNPVTNTARTVRSGTPGLGQFDQLVFVLVTSSSCRAATDTTLQRKIREVKQFVEQSAAVQDSIWVWSIGVSLDGSPAQAESLFEPFGSFNELLLGGGWIGTGAQEFIWTPGRTTPSIPEVIIGRRRVSRTPEQSLISGFEVITRLVGPALLDFKSDTTLMRIGADE